MPEFSRRRPRRIASAMLTLAASALTVLAAPPLAAQPSSGRWTLEAGRSDGDLQITFMGDDRHDGGMTSFGIAASELVGLSLPSLNGAGDSSSFKLVRDAGTIAFTGRVGQGLGIGRYAFTPNETFAAELARRGYGRPTERDAFRLALSDVGTTYLARLDALHYERPTIDDLVRLGTHGVSLAYLNEMATLGFNASSAREITRLRDHGVTATYAREMRASGYADATAEDLVRARDHGVDASFAAGFRDAGYGQVPLSALIRLRDHGVTPSYARAARSDRTSAPPSLDELVRRRDRGEP